MYTLERLKKDLENLKPGDHLACIYRNKKEQLSAVVPFILLGLENNEKCIYIIDENTKEDVIEAFKKAADTEEYTNSHQLEFLTRKDAYLKEGYFDPHSMITLLKQIQKRTLEKGYTGLRITGEMTWIFTGLPGVDKLIEYEARLNYFFPKSKCIALCQYNERRFTPEILLDVIHTHPQLIIYDSLYENPQYVPLDEFLARIKGEINWKIYEKARNSIIHKKKIEEKTKQQEKERRLILDSMSELVAFYGKDKRIKWVNRAAAESVSAASENFIGKFCHEIWQCRNGLCAPCHINRVWEIGMYAEGEITSGDGRIWHTRVNPVYEHEEMRGIVTVAQDVTDHKKTEAALRESEELYRKLVQTSPEAVTVTDLEGRITHVSERSLEMHRVTCADQLLGKNALELIAPEDRKRAMTNIEKTLKEGFVRNVDYTLVRKDGTRFIGELNAALIRDAEGNPKAFIATVRDITQRKRAEEALRESEEKFRLFFENEPEYCYMISPEGKILDINRSALRMLNYKKEELIGKPLLTTIYASSSHEKAQQLFTTWKKTGVVKNEELTVITKDGKERTVLLSVDSVRDADGKISHSVSVQRDITERKQAEEQIKATLKEKEVLLKEIHHRVKNNMQVVSSLLNLQANYIKDSDMLEVFKESQARISSMALVHDTLYQSENFADINFNDYIEVLAYGVLQFYAAQAEEIALEIEADSVSLGIDTAIPCGLIINELVSNALKHAFPERKGTITISFHARDEEEVELVVRDNGVGIPDDIDFRNCDSLGLQLVAILAEDQLDGRIVLDRSGGTAFHITFRRVNQ
ncbi:MAG: PAS domain S-box protein [Theionarchaea archaeon]|nr:MAG: hypothetical protein AYK18_02475 [Theionarchaea archaeon DG-70]MBU7012142.1 PAS domain S-box protein [Theionarchaea archaeon]